MTHIKLGAKLPGLSVAIFAVSLLGGAALAQDSTPASRLPVTPQQRVTADQVAQSGVPLSALAPNAPERYTVKSGDTLWDLSGMYLTSPWRWPELWGMNKTQIKNPHLIYPGQTLVLVKDGGRARLQLAEGEPGVGRLEPRIRDIGSERTAIAAIPNNLIAPFLSQPLVLDANGLADTPRIVATQEGRVFVGRGDDAYARGIEDDSIINYNVFRPLRPLYDPDDKRRKKPIAYEAFYLGTANKVGGGEIAKMRIDSSKQEIGIGDRLLPVERQELVTYMPKRPASAIDARVIAIYDGVRYAGGGQIITLSRGSDEGVSSGDVLQLLRTGETKLDRTAAKREFIKLPDEQIGLAFVFRVFPGISYALIQRGTKAVEVGDRASNPTDSLDLSTPTEREADVNQVLRQSPQPSR
ncbi:MAG TPA: LysM peptidoglycan-binding domain-containing protein [Burkholderiaceae bacterium]|nr:LysM peptidoglycan-binding domain-containing protein [Burkholderiaceae bacterium]